MALGTKLARTMAASILLVAAVSAHAEAVNGLQNLSVPLDSKTEDIEVALKALKTLLKSVHPVKKQAPTIIDSPSKQYILYGDLFHTGGLFHAAQNFALVELEVQSDGIGVGFAEWINNHWEPRSLLRINPIWRHKGSLKDGEYLPVTPPERPFWLMDLSGKGTTGVVVASDMGKWFQDFVVFKFDEKQHRLVGIAEAMEEPRLIDGWVRLYDKSPHRAIYEEWHFARWNGENLVENSSWHDEVPYNNIDPSFVDVTRTDDTGKTTIYHVVGDSSDDITKSLYTIKKDGKSFAHVSFNWGRSPFDVQPAGVNPSEKENEYLFEKITGLPRKLYPKGEEKTSTSLKLFKNISVTGDPEAVRMLSFKQ